MVGASVSDIRLSGKIMGGREPQKEIPYEKEKIAFLLQRTDQ